VSDKSLLEWFAKSAQTSPSLATYLSSPLSSLALPSLYLYASVVAAKANDTVLDVMRLMSDYGVSSVAVIEEEGGRLLSAVSVTDIGKVAFQLSMSTIA
jgi:CBS-domain-containing membrane protein